MHKHDEHNEKQQGHHHHDHEHGHHHGPHGHHHHGHEEKPAEGGTSTGEITDRVKLVKIMEHWIHHNEEHARGYEEWARRAEALGEKEVASLLEEMARDTRLHGEGLQTALTRMSRA